MLLSKNDTSRVVSGVATGVSAISPLLFLNRFLDDGTSSRVAVRIGPATEISFRF